MTSPGRPCPACQHAGPHAPLVIREMWFQFDDTFDYFECVGCGTVYIAEVPANLARFYEPDKYYSLQSDPEQLLGRTGVAQVIAALGRSILTGRNIIGSAFLRAPVRNVYMMASGFNAVAIAEPAQGLSSRVLDVGAGSGLLVYALHLAGMEQAVGIDPFISDDLSYANGARVLRRDLSDDRGTYDVVMLNHSFEHVPDPRAMLDDVRERLAPGGRAVIRIPTVSSEAYETYGVDLYSLDAPRHLTIFSRRGMADLCERAGFRIIRVVDDGNAAQFWASEQVRSKVPLASSHSHYIDPRSSWFSRRQIAAWEKRARVLNKAGRSDQAAWVLEPV